MTANPSYPVSFSFDPADPAFLVHEGGKIEVVPTKALRDRADLALLYTPGVAEVSRAIATDPSLAARYTARGNTVAVITATVLPRAVYRAASDGSVAMARETSATPGVYSRARSARSRNALVGTTSILPPSCTKNAGSAGSKLNDTGYDGLAVMVKITCSTGAGTPERHHLHAGKSQGVGYINASRGVSRRHTCSHIKAPLNTMACLLYTSPSPR